MSHGLNYDHASFLPLSVVATCSHSLGSFLIPALCGIHRKKQSASMLLFPSRLRDSDYNALYEVDIVTDVTEPSTIFRDRSFEVREEKGKSPRSALYNRQTEFIVAPFESTRNQRS